MFVGDAFVAWALMVGVYFGNRIIVLPLLCVQLWCNTLGVKLFPVLLNWSHHCYCTNIATAALFSLYYHCNSSSYQTSSEQQVIFSESGDLPAFAFHT